MDLDFSSDFWTTDNLEPLTLRTSNRTPGAADQPIAVARGRKADDKDPDQAGGNVQEGDRVWRWPVSQTPIQPPLGSLLIDVNGAEWTIISIAQKPLPSNVDAAQTRNLSVFYRLDNLAQVWRATYVKSPCGEAVATYTAVLTGIPARFQPLDTTEQLLDDAEWPKTTYRVILGTDIFSPDIPVEPASADYRLVDSSGRHYRIMKYTRAERIDALPIAECVLIIEGAEGNAQNRVTGSSSSGS